MTPQQRQQLQHTHDTFMNMYKQKQQQEQNIKQSFSKIEQKIDEQYSKSDPLAASQGFQLQVMEEDIDNELDDIIKINRDVNDINQMMHIMSDEVDHCQETINIIDETVE